MALSFFSLFLSPFVVVVISGLWMRQTASNLVEPSCRSASALKPGVVGDSGGCLVRRAVGKRLELEGPFALAFHLMMGAEPPGVLPLIVVNARLRRVRVPRALRVRRCESRDRQSGLPVDSNGPES